jgi:hypothetical protein
MLRFIIAGVVGGVAMFVWSSIAHMVLPLGQIGVGEIPNEEAVIGALGTTLGNADGLYIFPGLGLPENATAEQQNAAMGEYDKKLASQPSGLLIYHPPGAEGMTPKRLVTEFATELLEAFVVAFILATTALSTLPARLGLVVAIGAAAAVTTNVPYWNWYGFPNDYTLSYMSVEFVAYLAAGLVAIFIVKPPSPRLEACGANDTAAADGRRRRTLRLAKVLRATHVG